MPNGNGFDDKVLARIDQLVQQAVADGQAPGVAAVLTAARS
jgi:hypothetical protein